MNDFSDNLDRMLLENPDRKRGGIGLVSVVVMLVAFRADMSLLEIALAMAITFWGLHMVAGLRIRWW